MKDEEEKNARVILSEGEAEAARLINDSVKLYGTGKAICINLLQLKSKLNA
jgi:prohibitin 1